MGSAGDRPAAGDRPPPGALPPSAVRRDRLRDGWEGPAGKVARGGRRPPVGVESPLPECYSPLGSSSSPNPGAEGTGHNPSPRSPPLLRVEAGPPLPRRDRSPTSPPSSGGPGVGADCPQCAPGVVAPSGRGGSVGHAALSLSGGGGDERTGSAAMSATHPTRLETRTKESNACASQGLVRKPPWRNEGEGSSPPSGGGCPRWDPEASPSPPRAHHRPVSPAAPGRWSTSVRVRTRKMVNYAWAGRSQRKLWWRSVAVLTCKSVVRPGYRGERLIEPSSSWFPPKFPSG